MNKFFLGVCVVLMSGLTATAQKITKPVAKIKAPVSNLKNAADTFAYGLGMNIANNLKDQGVQKISMAALQQAMTDIFSSKKTVINEQQANTSIQTTLQALAAKKAVAEKAAGIAFLEKNKKRTGVITLADGLQYEVLKKGDSTSVMPKAEDTIIAHYAGSLIDGKEFDNSNKRGEPLTIKANEVIKGWTEIVQHMHIGDKWKVYIPSELGYGERGAGADIPPGATLIFELELLGVKPFAAMATPHTPAMQAPVEDVTPKPLN